jgi:hypothetical protein
MRREHRKNRTRIGPHLAQPWAAERPVISVLEIGYVRRSEIRPRFPSSAFEIGRYPGTRLSADPVYKVVRSGALAEEMKLLKR